MRECLSFDILFIGAYTKDQIVTGTSRRTVDGGAFYYGASVAARTGLSVAAVTRLAAEDAKVIRKLKALGVTVNARLTPASTCLRLRYVGNDPDQRDIDVLSTSGPFTPGDLAGWKAPVAVVGASFRGEVGMDILSLLASRGCRLALDAQGFVRVIRDGRLAHEDWPEASTVLPLVSILKADANECELLTGTRVLREAAPRLLGMGANEVILTDRDGALAADGREMHEAPFLPKKLIGRSGRGDTCLAAYAAQRINRPMEESLVWAAAATSCKLEGDGPFHASAGEVESRLAEIRARSPDATR
jgi:sugar/nucleoside kinase (ribokinase family)